MRTQTLRHRITFQEQIQIKDSNGDREVDWQNVVLESGEELENVPAEVLTGPGREFNNSGTVQSDVTARITCRWFPGGINAAWRILWDGQVFNIGAIPDTDVSARREYRIRCTAGVNDGQ